MPAELSILTRYPCVHPGCKEYFKKRDDFNHHISTCHGAETTENFLDLAAVAVAFPDENMVAEHDFTSESDSDEILYMKSITKKPKKVEEPEEYDCTYATCHKVFKTDREMRQHKENDPEHDYCRKCDMDCKDWDEYLKHKIDSADHISCPICGLNYKSTGGMERHVKLNHHLDHDLRCAGCDEHFARAGGLIAHLEKGRCRNKIDSERLIVKNKFQQALKHKKVLGRILNHPNPEETFTGPGSQDVAESGQASSTQTDWNQTDWNRADSWATKSNPTSNGPSEEDGGVLLDIKDEDQDSGFPPLAPSTTVKSNTQTNAPLIGARNYRQAIDKGVIETRIPSASITTGATIRNESMNQYEDLPSSPATAAGATIWDALPASVKHPLSDAQPVVTPAPNPTSFKDGLREREAEFARANRDARASTKNGTGTTKKAIVDDEAAARRFAKASEAITGKCIDVFTSHFWDPNHADFDAKLFFNQVVERYCCPFDLCEFRCQNPDYLAAHLRSDKHNRKLQRCPSCLKVFRTHAALIQHCEAPSVKCKIRLTEHFGRFMDEISGGFISVKKREEFVEEPLIEDGEGDGVQVEWWDTTERMINRIRRNDPRYEVSKPKGFW